MPIIKSDKSKKTEKVKFIVDSSLLSEINDYCKWAKVDDIGVFFAQAAEFVLKKDKDWKKHNKKS